MTLWQFLLWKYLKGAYRNIQNMKYRCIKMFSTYHFYVSWVYHSTKWNVLLKLALVFIEGFLLASGNILCHISQSILPVLQYTCGRIVTALILMYECPVTCYDINRRRPITGGKHTSHLFKRYAQQVHIIDTTNLHVSGWKNRN